MKIKLKKYVVCSMLLCFIFGKAQNARKTTTVLDPVDYVNPYMGNISHLLVPTYPTIHLPNSMLRVYPERKDYTGVVLKGLPVVVTSHRGSSAFNISTFQGSEKEMSPVMEYSYDLEKIKPYSYQVYLDEQKTTVDFGVSHQSALYQFSFEKEAPVYFILNSKEGALTWDGTALSGFQWIDKSTKVYLYLILEKKPTVVSSLVGQQLVSASTSTGTNANLVLHFPKNTKTLKAQYGISFQSVQQAKQNVAREIGAKTLTQVQKEGRAIWNASLGKIKVGGGTLNEKTVFYTSLYRCFERSVCISEDGKYYSAFDKKIHQDLGRPFYTDDWIWDSYRAQHPLRVLLDPKVEGDILNSFVLMAEQMDQLWLPTFPEITGDSRRMNSNHGIASIVDAYKKGLRNFDVQKAYAASKGAIENKTLAPWSGLAAGELDAFYKKNGYFPALAIGEEETIPEVHTFESRQPVAVTLGTAYDAWCLSELASELGNTADAEYFKKASFNYRNLFHPDTHFFHPKDKNGHFIQPFDYVNSGGMGARKYYGENNGWIYRWDVQHNIPDLIQLMGGNEAFTKNLDGMFSKALGKSKFEFYAQLPDHSGNVGQFSMANEPSLHIPYLYNFAGQPWKTQKYIRQLLQEWFRNDLMGVPGDEDGGGLSAFVVFSQLGFYPVTPGIPIYSIGSPVFAQARIQLAQGKFFEVIAKNYAEDNKYIQSATLNGKPLDTPWFSHEVLQKGGILELTMGNKPNLLWGTNSPAYAQMAVTAVTKK
ncbi:GH92 family glycosyl hydrolase [Flavobacterium sp. TSSA_36]|uniref:GH92 family glycosyl hydrolase n=1 Tax=Flavobacterium sp. TSSA_36 TaxID=3447669 RepID=UPI003F2B0E77